MLLKSLDTSVKKHDSILRSYAFITFETHEDAARAIKEVNYIKLDGVPIRISWTDPETARIRKSGLGNLFIRGLDESIEVSQLYDAFLNFGDIISCRIPLTNGKSRGYGYVQFRNPADAEKALADLQDASINGKPITIEPYVKPSAREKPEESYTNVFIKAEGRDAKLPYTTDEELSKVFEPFGEITSAMLTRDENNEPKGFGFCNFKQHEEAVKAVEELNGTQRDGVKLVVCRAMTINERKAHILKNTEEYHRIINQQTKGRNIYVKGFGRDVTDEEFEEYFKQFGEVEKFKIARSEIEPFESKGFGFVLYSRVDEAIKAFMKSSTIRLKGSEIFVSLFKNKEDRTLEKTKETRRRKQLEEMRKQFNMPMPLPMPLPMQMQMPLSKQMPLPLPMQKQMPLQIPMPLPMQVQTNKDRLKQKLIDRNINGQELKNRLSRVSDEQAKILCDIPERFDRWLDIPMMPTAGNQTNKNRLKQKLLEENITGQELKKKLSSVSEEEAKILCDNQDEFIKWMH